MFSILAFVLLMFFAAFGLVCLLYCLTHGALSDKEETLYLLLPADSRTADLELGIKRAKLQQKSCFCARTFLIILDNGMSHDMREIALREAEENQNIFLMTPDELKKLT